MDILSNNKIFKQLEKIFDKQNDEIILKNLNINQNILSRHITNNIILKEI